MTKSMFRLPQKTTENGKLVLAGAVRGPGVAGSGTRDIRPRLNAVRLKIVFFGVVNFF